MVAQNRLLDNRWDDAKAATLDEPGKLLYRSNLLGSDKRITNYGGGNTSAKVQETDPSLERPFRYFGLKALVAMLAPLSLTVFRRFIRISSTH